MTLSPEDEELNRKLREQFAAITHHFATSADLTSAFERSRDAILTEIRRIFPAAELYNVGPDRDRRSDWWECYIEVDTDERRDALRRDNLLMQRLKQAGERGGFAPVLIELESRETVRRDYKDSWFLRLH